MRTLTIMLLLTSTAMAQTMPVTPNVMNYGPGRIDASTTYQHIGQTVTTCGRAVQNNPRSADLVMGVSPYETAIMFPKGTDPHISDRFNGQIVCATGLVDGGYGFGVSAAIHYPSRVELAAMPQSGQRPCGPCMLPNGQITGRACYGGGLAPRQPFPPCQME